MLTNLDANLLLQVVLVFETKGLYWGTKKDVYFMNMNQDLMLLFLERCSKDVLKNHV